MTFEEKLETLGDCRDFCDRYKNVTRYSTFEVLAGYGFGMGID